MKCVIMCSCLCSTLNTGTAEWLPSVLCDDLNKICKLNRILSKTNSPGFLFAHISVRNLPICFWFKVNTIYSPDMPTPFSSVNIEHSLPDSICSFLIMNYSTQVHGPCHLVQPCGSLFSQQFLINSEALDKAVNKNQSGDVSELTHAHFRALFLLSYCRYV